MNIVQSVDALIEAQKVALNGLPPVMELLTDKSIPLEDRWTAYTTLVENNALVKEDIYSSGYIEVLGENLTMYDDFYIERHETKSFVDLYDQIVEADGEYQKDIVEAREKNLEEWQEKVLASGYSTFTYDW